MVATMQPISFPVSVDGVPMTASIIEELVPSYHFIFRVRFSNGFEDLFYLGAAGIHGDNQDSVAYAKAISMDIDHVIGLDPENFYHIYQEYIDGLLTNVWIIERKTAFKTSYVVYYNRFYRFELTRENEQWVASTTAKIYPNLNFELARKVSLLLDKLL